MQTTNNTSLKVSTSISRIQPFPKFTLLPSWPTMFRGRAKGRMGAGNDSIQKVPLKGLYSDGTWKCNCDPRLPVQRFQTKNGGKNHGRWCTRLPLQSKEPFKNLRAQTKASCMISLYMPATPAEALRLLALAGRRESPGSGSQVQNRFARATVFTPHSSKESFSSHHPTYYD